MNRIIKLSGVAAAVWTLSMGGAFAAQTACGQVPELPDMPEDGSTVASKDMDAVAEAFDDYQEKYVDFSRCTNAEFTELQKKFEKLLDEYASKGKK